MCVYVYYVHTGNMQFIGKHYNPLHRGILQKMINEWRIHMLNIEFTILQHTHNI